MTCILDINKVPDIDKPVSFNLDKFIGKAKKGLVTVYDLENEGWRSVPVDRIIKIVK